MNVYTTGETVQINGLTELGAENANWVRDRALAALTPLQHHIEIDLSQTTFVDSCGLGALLTLHKSCHVRLVNPPPSIEQILELTRMHQVFEIVHQ